MRRAALAVVLVAFSAAASGADPRADFAARVPGDACLAVYSADLAATCKAFQQTDLGRSFTGADFVPLIKELSRRETASPLHLQPAFGFDWSDLAQRHHAGGMVIFPLNDGSTGAGWVFLSEAPADQTPQLLAAATMYFTAKGFRATSERRAGGTLTVLARPANRSGAASPTWFVGQGFFGVANSITAADALLTVTPEGSLGSQSLFKQLSPAEAAKNAGAADVDLCLRPVELAELAAAAHERAVTERDTNSTKAGADKSVDRRSANRETRGAKAKRLGWDALQMVTARIRLGGDDPCQWQLSSRAPSSGPYRGVMRLFDFKPGAPVELPAWVRADVVSMSAFRWDFPEAIQGFGSLYDEANEPGPDGEGMFEDMLDGLRDDPEGVQVDLRRDVFGQVGPEITSVAKKAKQVVDGQPPTLHWLYVVEARDESKVREAFARFYKEDEKVRHVRAGEYDVWTIAEGGSLFVEGESESLVTVRALAVGSGKLLFCTDTALLMSAIEPRQAGVAFGDDPQWQKMIGWIRAREDAGTAVRSLVHLADALEGSYFTATSHDPTDKDPLGVRLWRRLLFGSTHSTDEDLRSLVPRYDRLRPVLARGALLMSRTENGWVARFGALGSETTP